MSYNQRNMVVCNRAREIVGFAGSGPIFESYNRFCPQQEAKKWVHKSSFFSVPFSITVYNSYLSMQFTVNFTPYYLV